MSLNLKLNFDNFLFIIKMKSNRQNLYHQEGESPIVSLDSDEMEAEKQ